MAIITTATNLNEASQLFIPDANKIHQILNGDADTTVSVENGYIPTIRKVYADNLYFYNEVLAWTSGNNAVSSQQLYNFGGLLYWAPSATSSDIVPLGTTPVGDDSWQVAPTRWNYLQAAAIVYNTTVDNVALLQTGDINTDSGVNYFYDADNQVVYYYNGDAITGNISTIGAASGNTLTITMSDATEYILTTNDIVNELKSIAIANNTSIDNVAFLYDRAVLTGQEYLRVASEEKTYFVAGGVAGTVSDSGTDVNRVRTISTVSNGDFIAVSYSINNKIIDWEKSGGLSDGTNQQAFFESMRDYCISQGLSIQLPAGLIELNVFKPSGVPVFGVKDKTTINLVYDSNLSVVMGQAQDNDYYQDISFESQEADLENQRFGFSNVDNVRVVRCAFKGFRHDDPAPNAWGAYFDNASNCKLTDCHFENNSQSDFAIVDGCSNIVIESPISDSDSLVVNFEPNAAETNSFCKVSNANISVLYLLLNSRTSNSLQNIVIENCKVDLLNYDGADVTFINSEIASVSPYPDSLDGVYAGNVDFIGCNLAFGQSKIIDRQFATSAGASSGGNWVVNSSTITSASRLALYNEDLRGVTINPSNLNGQVNLRPETNVTVDPDSTYIFSFSGKVNPGSTFLGNYANVREYDSSDTLLNEYNVRCFRSQSATETAMRVESVFINTSSTASYLIITFRNSESSSTNSVTLFSCALNKVFYAGAGCFEQVKNEHINEKIVTVKNSDHFASNFSYRIQMVNGDECIVGSDRYIVTDASVYNGDHWLGDWSLYDKTAVTL